MMQFVAAIELRGNELLKIYDTTIQDDADYESSKPARSGYSSATLQINRLPSTVEDYSDDEDEDEDDDQRPFTKEELKTKTMRGIHKKQKKSRMKSVATSDK